MITDHRLHPRVEAELPAQLILGKGISLDVTLANLSTTGLMINASQSDFDTLLSGQPDNSQLKEPVELGVRFKLTGKRGGTIAVSTECRAIYVRRIAQNKFYIGFKFLKLNNKNETAINHYVFSNLKS